MREAPDMLEERRRAVRRALSAAFAGEDGDVLRRELAALCGEGEDLYASARDDRDLHYLLGRRSVWLALMDWTKQEEDEEDA